MITNEELKNLSKLARIDIKDEELLGLSKDINSILDYVGQIQNVSIDKDVKNVNSLKNIMREDKNPHVGGEFSKDLLKEAPDKKDSYVKVKKIL
ncbi:MAG: Asp-tRNA(Asn)/Glu-tRNA(Gln) amidotransferase subunit GatC [Candidatus Paceibacterota bacterium]